MTSKPGSQDAVHASGARATLWGHLQIMRPDHWVKNVFVLPGIVVALALDPSKMATGLWLRLAIGLASVCLIASSNYTLNELLDAPFDRLHPSKAKRPVVAGLVSKPLAIAQWLGLMAVGLFLAGLISRGFLASMAALWVMGCIYNIPPVRSKDIPYVDVLSEAINNPLRMLAGWYIVNPSAVIPVSLLLSYWMVGSYFMAIKRFAEYRHIADKGRAAAYRRSFAFYTEPRLLVSITFYSAAAMLFLGAFTMRYRLELILSFPFIALVMAIYLALAFSDDSAVQAPEKLHKEPALMAAVIVCTVVMTVLLIVDLPYMHTLFAPTLPTAP